MQQLLNRLKFNASLELMTDTVDEDDRPVKTYAKKRILKYGPLGITTNDKEYGANVGHNVTHKIECRLDYEVVDHESDYRVVIRGQRYAISRNYVDDIEKRMELTLYADNPQRTN